MGQEVPDRGGQLAPGRPHVIQFFAFPPEVRRVIYKTNAIESGSGTT
jgi:transposase-like protein